MKSLVSIITLLIATCICGQTVTSSWESKSNRAYKEGKLDSALYYVSLAEPTPSIELRRVEIQWKFGALNESLQGINRYLSDYQNSDNLLAAYLLKGKILFSMGEPMASVALMDSIFPSLKSSVYQSEALNTKAKSLIWAGKASNASTINDQADSIYQANGIEHPILLGNIYNVKGIVFYLNGDFDHAIENFERAIDEKKKALATTHPDIISLFGNTGVMYKNKQEFDKALQYYGYELENYAKSLGEDHPLVATTYLNIGNIYGIKAEYDLALQSFSKSLKIRKDKLGDDNPLTLDIYEWLGNIYADIGEYSKAQAIFNKVLKGRIQNFGEENHFVSLTYYNLGEINYISGNYEESLKNFRKAADIGEVVYTKENFEQAGNYNGIGMSLDALGNLDEAKRFYFLSLEQSFPGYQWNGNGNQPPRITNYLKFDEVFTSLIGLAKSHAKSQNLKALETALEFVERSRELIDIHKRSLTIKSDQVLISRSAKELADVAIEINFQLFEQTEDVKYQASIFQWSEYVKGTTLLSTLSDQKARQFSGIPEELLAQEHRFRIEKDSIKSLISESDQKNSDSNLIESLLETEKKHEEFIEFLENEYPKYSEMKYGLKPISIHDISKSIHSPNKAIIQYFVSNQNRIFASIITNEGHEVVVTKYPKLEDKVADLRKSLDEINDSKFVQSSKELYRAIFQPLAGYLQGVDQLTIIPDGILGYIPFELLLNGDGKYLLETYLIKYDLSSTMLAQRIDEKSSVDKLLAYAPEFGTSEETNSELIPVRSEALEALPGAINEVEEIKAVISGELRIGSNATESLFKSESAEFDILHLATHSIINQRDPNYTKLMFAPDEYEDGELHIYELENLSLNARLVTLSACNTGIGKIAEGEGVMSLARSFRSVGVPSVVMSLWPASDKSTPELMKYFYQNLKDGQTKDEALNNARKSYLSTAEGKARHPFYWGGFVLIGDNSPINNERNLLVYVIPSVLVIVTILTVYRRKKNYQS